MELWLEIDGELLDFDITRQGDDILVSRDGETHCATIEHDGAGYNVTVDGKVFEMKRDGDEPGGLPGQKLKLDREGASHEVIYVPRKSIPAVPATELMAEDGAVLPLMPGTIIEVNCELSAKVEKGDIILIIEAMKMLNEVRAPVSGTVTEINVKPGDNVARNTLMVRITE